MPPKKKGSEERHGVAKPIDSKSAASTADKDLEKVLASKSKVVKKKK